ncbi:4-(cytidine 5'-diphospho)-2-C-methyl-D-erythritol kinase [Planctomycetota bacterium]
METLPQFETTQTGLLVRAPAKINLSLLIAGKRPDGFHEIETVMAKVSAYDEIIIEKGDTAGIDLTCQGSCWAPEGPENLVYRAADLLLQHSRRPANLRIALHKNIPAGTGLGTASSDAAATLLGVAKFLDLKISHNTLTELAATLGSDVPFFLQGPLAYCTGRGEKIMNLEHPFHFTALLVIPDLNISTARVYKHYRHDHDTYQDLHHKIHNHISKNRIDLIAKICANTLSVSCYQLETSLADLKHKLESLGMGSVCLSGSGSAMYSIVESGIEEARRIQRIIERATNCLTRIVTDNRW